MTGDVWAVGDAYEVYVGRWSRRVAPLFVGWLGVGAGRRWLDAGCGTGALTSAILAAGPADVVGVDPSRGFLRSALDTARVAGDAAALPLRDGVFDAVVSGLALNFVPDPARAVAEFARVAAPGAVVAAYVWDYAGGMQMMRHFWDVAADPEHDESRRFPICQEGPLREAWAAAGLTEVATRSIEIPTVFASFDDYWTPFLGGQGAAPAYLATLSDDRRRRIREDLRARLPAGEGGEIALTARAWAVRGHKTAG
ncbi:methyltransferase [Paractinoplanes deccanensis]|uniref:Methyltransferase n=1 Tax=Paractinoplanes deccanensis TaxID=113561 RepID=A0ABQ3XVC0_9ACTN|nr:class I SAM-dependent methyltransferase [Actinoplanes deccanensis]GID71689.1 methyltransferase [Actinoplanes deccanensis]